MPNKIVVLILGLSFFKVFGQESAIPNPVVCHFNEEDAFTQILDDTFLNSRRAATSDIVVVYTNFPNEAKAAFEKAVSIWEGILISKMPIRINAVWEDVNGTTLAFSGATRIYRNTDNVPYRDVWYVGPLAEAIAGKDLNNGDFDINVTLNSNANWSYSTDGSTFSGRFDMVTVVMHEIAHGLGFSSSMKLINNESEGQWGQSGFPYIYDMFIENEDGRVMIEKDNFQNPSLELKNQMVSDQLVFNVTNLNYEGRQPEIFSPNPFKDGASLSHLDFRNLEVGSSTYSLMSPAIRSSLVIYSPGREVLTILNEIGWPVNNLESFTILASEPEPKILIFPNPTAGTLAVAMPESLSSESTEVLILDNLGRTREAFYKNTLKERTFYLTLNNLNPGQYFMKINSEKGSFTKKLLKL